MSHAELTAACVYITLDEEEFKLTRLCDRDIAELDLWLRSEFVKTARASLTPDMTKAERQEVLSVAMNEAAKITWLSPRGAELISSPPGLARILWQCSKTHHPEETYEAMRERMYQAVNVRAFNETFKELNPKLPPSMRKKGAPGSNRGSAQKKVAKRKKRAAKRSTRS